jgi:hypothetical protein
MAILDHFHELDRRVLTSAWTVEERRSLLCIVREIHRADGVYSPAEREDYERLASDLDVEDCGCPDLADCVLTLRGDERKRRLLCIWMAEAVLADGRYDEKEQDFLDSVCSKYLLPRAELESTIREIQLRDIDEVLRQWIDQTTWDPSS